ncbi:MAG TPA: hypothetical protein VFN65_01415 [Solirubrobacteraceae bacterium]|nr:hypothetical protein [Solirubrobacteraceae bacterium]
MLDGRIYRMSLIIPALALLVLAFSLTPQPAGLHSALSPIAFNGTAVNSSMRELALQYPSRRPGSAGDRHIAATVGGALGRSGFSVSTDRFVEGRRVLENVVASRAGSATGSGAVVVVAPRGQPGVAGLSGTAMLMELASVLGGQALQRPVVLASVSGGAGSVGALRLAAQLPRPVDAVVVLGDVASTPRVQPVLIPWGGVPSIAPPRLRNTLSSALAVQARVHAAVPRVLSQLAHLAFPFTVSAQGPFIAQGLPAIDLSFSGERGPRPGGRAVAAGALGGIGQGVLEAVSALDKGRSVGTPSGDVVFDGEIVPSWAISGFVLALIVPMLLVLVDGLARARRRRHPIGHALLAVGSAAVPFLCAGLVLVIGNAVGAMSAPPGPAAPGAAHPSAGAIAIMAVALLAGLGGGLITRSGFERVGARQAERPTSEGPRPASVRGPRRVPDRPADGTAIAMGLVLVVVALLLWYEDPLAAALVVPALHLWIWGVDSELAMPGGAWVRSVMLALGVLPVVALVLFYGDALGFGPGQLAYEAVVLLAGHVVSWLVAVEWALVLGCLVTAVVLVVAEARRPEPAAAPVTVRGPLGYAGPGSLGGTKSALRR